MQRLIVPILIALAMASVSAFWIVPPIAQPQWYHDFADKRSFLGIANFSNVISNIPFLFIGGWGIWHVVTRGLTNRSHDSIQRLMYLCLFSGVALTGAASAYYHWEPNNERLVWDRLPIAITIMTLFVIVIAELVNRQLGVWLFLPLVAAGAATVFYWYLTETCGRGDLRPYFIAQFYPLLAIAVILALSPVTPTRTGYLYAALGCYGTAKFFEFTDGAIYSCGGIVSGHTLKHLAAGVSCYLILAWIRNQRITKDSKV